MDVSLMILIDSIIGVVIALLFCFFGYKLARPLFPLPGMILLEVLIYIYIYSTLKMNTLGTWLFFGGINVILYVLLFFIQRIAGFFTGLLGSAMLLLYVVNTFGLQNISYLYPICFTICVVSGLLTVVYEKKGVIIFTSIFGACAVSFIGMHLFIKGVSNEIIKSGNIVTYLGNFLSANALLIAGISIAASVIGILIQLFATSEGKTLKGSSDRGFGRRTHNDNLLSETEVNKETDQEL